METKKIIKFLHEHYKDIYPLILVAVIFFASLLVVYALMFPRHSYAKEYALIYSTDINGTEIVCVEEKDVINLPKTDLKKCEQIFESY